MLYSCTHMTTVGVKGLTDPYRNKPVDELARVLLSFKRPTRRHRTATVPIIRNFHFGVGLRQMILLPEFMS